MYTGFLPYRDGALGRFFSLGCPPVHWRFVLMSVLDLTEGAPFTPSTPQSALCDPPFSNGRAGQETNIVIDLNDDDVRAIQAGLCLAEMS